MNKEILGVSRYVVSSNNLYCYDKDVLLARVSQTYHKAHTTNPPFRFFIKDDKDFSTALKVATADLKLQGEIYLEEKAEKKWIYPQGGHASQEELAENVATYVHLWEENREYQHSIEDYFYQEACTVASYIDFGASKVWIKEDIEELTNSWSGRIASSGFSTLEKKSRALAEKYAAEVVQEDFLSITPIIVGSVIKDSKVRTIFMDSFYNYMYEAKYFDTFLKSIANLSESAHWSDAQTSNMILCKQAACAYAGDYEAMDKHITVDTAKATIRLGAKIFGIDVTETKKLCDAIEEILTTPLLVGNEIWVPLYYWNWLSGILPTHDFESLQNILIHHKLIRTLGFEFVPFNSAKRLKSNQATFVVCGDDSILLLGSVVEKEKIAQLHSDIAAHYGQIVEPSKVDYSLHEIFFCKKLYKINDEVKGYKSALSPNEVLSTPAVPKYSIQKAINTLYHPQHVPSKLSKEDLFLWFCSVMDNAYGMKNWKQVINWFWDHNLEYFTSMMEEKQMPHISASFKEYMSSDFWTQYLENVYSEELPSSAYTWNYLYAKYLTWRNTAHNEG